MEHILPPTAPGQVPPHARGQVPDDAAITGGIGDVCYPRLGDMVASAYRGLDEAACEIAEIIGLVPQLLGLARCRLCKVPMSVTVDIPVGVVYHCDASAVRHLHRVSAAEVHHWAWKAYLADGDRAPIPDQRCDEITKRALFLRHLHAVDLEPRVDASRLITCMWWRTT